MLAFLLAGVTGCWGTGKELAENDIIVPQGRITVEKSGDEITVTKGKVTKTWTAKSLSERALGFPVPESAKLVAGTAIEVSSTPGNEKWLGATFSSEESVGSIVEYYKSELSGMEGYEDTSKMIGGQEIGLFSIKSGGTVKSVIIKPPDPGEEGKTEIQIATAEGTTG